LPTLRSAAGPVQQAAVSPEWQEQPSFLKGRFSAQLLSLGAVLPIVAGAALPALPRVGLPVFGAELPLLPEGACCPLDIELVVVRRGASESFDARV
jgi:uncharacterized RDD family membrane protein YckC